MSKKNEYYRKVSNSERFYQVCEKIAPPFCIQMMVEGKGNLLIEELSEAIKEVSNVNKGTRLILKRNKLKEYWEDTFIPPPVRVVDENYFLQFDEKNSIMNNSKNPYLYNRLDIKTGPTCEVLLIKGETIRILFRALHAVMDARGLLFWAEEVFRYLNKEPLLGTNTKLTDIECYKMFEQNSKVKKVPLGARSPSPLGKKEGNENHYLWGRRRIYGNYHTLVSQLAFLLTQESYKHSNSPVSFMIPADLRNKENNFRSTGNLSSPMYIHVKKEDSWLDIYAEIINIIKENRDKQVDKTESLVHFIPVNFLSNILDNYLKRIYKKDAYLFSVATSNLGKINIKKFSNNTFLCTNAMFFPVDLPGFSISVISVETPEFVELFLSAPSFIANNGRLEKLMESLEEGLKKLNNVISIKSNLAKDEEKKQIEVFNNTTSLYPKDKNIIHLFEKQVELTPDNIAISMDNINLTYKELNEKSNSFANYLINLGQKQGEIIALLTKHSIETIISILGILKSGNAYLPIDPEHPADRIKFMLEDANVNFLITNLEKIEFYPNEKTIYLKDEMFDSENKIFLTKENFLAYVMYTSGSTGKPKGVKVTNLNLVNYIHWVKKYGILENEKTIYPFYTSLSFDLTLTSIFLPLVSGNQIEVYKNEYHKFAIKKIIDDKKANIIKLTPTHLKVLKELETDNINIKKIITLGEPLSIDLAKSIYQKFGSKIEIINQYGPTEATIGCMAHKFDFEKEQSDTVPIGVPGDNTYIYLLNENQEEVSIGSVGEIYISGDCVANGYLNRDDLTQKCFLKDPFRKNEIMYKTGDLALRLPNFEIEYIGRVDEQVKLKGFRIEIGDIESTILEYKKIKECIVLVKEKSNENIKYLVAYYISDEEVNTKELKNFLETKLPYYMIPSNYVSIKEIPLTVNGKINKKALLNIEETKNYIEHSNFEDKITKSVFESVYQVIPQIDSKIDENMNLFELGIDSLTMTNLFSKLTKDLIPVEKGNYLMQNLENILINPTIKNLVDIIKKV
ncbi:MAG: amino acid adenylation domain-containing protein [Cyanobacteriota bacterium]